MEIRIFYSWQSDLPDKSDRETKGNLLVPIDRDTKGMLGSRDFQQTLSKKTIRAKAFAGYVSPLGPNVTPENDPTLQQYGDAFDADGFLHPFSHHLRYTPGLGRIYCQPLKPERVLIGYVGKRFSKRNYP